MTRPVYPSDHTEARRSRCKGAGYNLDNRNHAITHGAFFRHSQENLFPSGWDRFADQYGKGVDTNEYSFDGVPERPLSGVCSRKDIYNKGLFFVKRNISQSVPLATTHPKDVIWEGDGYFHFDLISLSAGSDEII